MLHILCRFFAVLGNKVPCTKMIAGHKKLTRLSQRSDSGDHQQVDNTSNADADTTNPALSLQDYLPRREDSVGVNWLKQRLSGRHSFGPEKVNLYDGGLDLKKQDSCYFSDTENNHSDASRTVSTVSTNSEGIDPGISPPDGVRSKPQVTLSRSASACQSNQVSSLPLSSTFHSIPSYGSETWAGRLKTSLRPQNSISTLLENSEGSGDDATTEIKESADQDLDDVSILEVPQVSEEYSRMLEFAVRLGYSETKLVYILQKCGVNEMTTDRLLQVCRSLVDIFTVLVRIFLNLCYICIIVPIIARKKLCRKISRKLRLKFAGKLASKLAKCETVFLGQICGQSCR